MKALVFACISQKKSVETVQNYPSYASTKFHHEATFFSLLFGLGGMGKTLSLITKVVRFSLFFFIYQMKALIRAITTHFLLFKLVEKWMSYGFTNNCTFCGGMSSSPFCLILFSKCTDNLILLFHSYKLNLIPIFIPSIHLFCLVSFLGVGMLSQISQHFHLLATVPF